MTGESGRFSLPAVPPGAGVLTVLGPGWATVELPLWVEPGLTTIVLPPMPRAAAIAGTLRDDEGHAVEGARIRALPLEGTGGPGGETRTDRAGGFRIDGLHPGEHTLGAEAAGLLPSGEPQLMAPTSGVELRLTRLHAIRGRVEGGPASAIRVWIAGSGVWPARSIPAHADGSFRLEGIPTGAYELVARSERAPFLASEITAGILVGAGARAGEVRLQLLPAERVSGQLLDPRGLPVPEGELSLGRSSLSVLQNRTKADREGRFSFQPVPAGRYGVAAWAAGFLPMIRQEIRIPRGEPLILRLSPGAILKGSLNDPDGNPVADAIITVRYRGGTREADRSDRLGELGVIAGPVPPIPPPGVRLSMGLEGPSGASATAVSDRRGGFVLSGLQPELEIIVSAEHPDYARAESGWIRASETGPLRLVLQPGTLLAGQILDELGRPVEGAQVIVSVAGEREVDSRLTLSDRLGRYSFAGLPGRRVTVSASRNGYGSASRGLLLKRPRQELDLVLEPAAGRVEGTVYAPQRLPLAGARVRVKGGAPSATSDAAGRFELQGIGRKPVVLEVLHPGYGTAEVRAAPGAVLAVELRLLGSLGGLVQDQRTGMAVSSGSVLCEVGHQRQRIGFRDPRGVFRLVGIPVGAATLTFDAPGYALRVIRVKVEEPGRGGPGREDLRVALQAAGQIEGRVSELVSGAPLASASVSVAGVSTTTSATGEFRLARIPEGTHSILVRAKDGRTLHSDPIIVRGGETASQVRLLLR
jgi:hypothetical protein